MNNRGTSLDFVFSNLVSGSYSGASIAFHPSGTKLLVPQGNRLVVFDVTRGESTTHYVEHPSPITHVAVSDVDDYVVTSDKKFNIFITQLGSNGLLHKKVLKKPISSIAFAPSRNGFAVSSDNKIVMYKYPSKVSPVKPFIALKRYAGHFDSVESISFSSDGSLFATCSKDMTVRVYMREPTEDFSPLALTGHRGKPLFAVFSREDKSLTTLGADGTCFVWDISEDFSIKILSRRRLDEDDFENPKNRYHNISVAAFNRDSIIAGYPNGSFKTFPVISHSSPLKSTFSVTFSAEKVAALAISPKYAAFTSEKLGEMVIWDLQNGSVAQRSQGHFGGVSCFDYSPNGIVVATGGDDGKLKIWDSQSGSCLMTFAEHFSPITSVVFGESGRTVVTSSLDGTCKAFDVVKGRCFRTFMPPEKCELSSVALDRQSEFVASCSRTDFKIFIWSMQSGKIVEELTGHTAPISSLSFTPTIQLVSGSWDGSVKIWDFLETQSSKSYEAKGEITDCAVSPDGKVLAMTTSNGILLFYEVESNNYIGEINCSSDAKGGKFIDGERSSKNINWCFDTISFSPDGSFVVCGGRTKFICIYSVVSLLLMRRLQHTINTEFSGVEAYFKKYHGSGKSEQKLQAQFEQRSIIDAASLEVRWCPTGRGIAAATPEGLLIYTSADEFIVDPLELETDVTPEALLQAIVTKNFVRAIVIGIRLGHSERDLLKQAMFSVPVNDIDFVVHHIPQRFSVSYLQFLGELLKESNQVELIIKWIRATLRFHSKYLSKHQSALSATHLLQKSISYKTDLVKEVTRENYDILSFLCNQLN